MRRVPMILLALLVILAVSVVQDSGAGWFKKNKEPRQERQAQRFDRLPTMSFFSGKMTTGLSGTWELDGRPLDFAPGCTVISMDEAGEAQVASGSDVVLMGTKDGGTIVAWRILVQSPNHQHAGQAAENPSIVWSNSNPTVGVGGPAEF